MQQPALVPTLAAALFLSSPLAAADPALVNLSRPDVNFVMGVEVSRIASSPLLAAAMEEAQQTKPGFDTFFGLLAPHPLRYLNEIVIAAKLDPDSDSKKPENLLIMARGAFAGSGFSDIVCSQGCAADEYREFQVLRLTPKPGEDPMHFAFLDSQYAVMGSPREVQGAIDRRVTETNSVFSDAIQEGIARLGGHDIWLVAKGVFQDAADAGGDGGPGMMAEQVASKMDGMGLGITLGKDVRFALELRSHTPEQAKQVFDMATGLLAMMKTGEGSPESKQMIERLSLRHEGHILAVSMRIPEAEVRAQLREKAAKHREQLAADGSVSPTPATRPRREGGIRIYGLKDEPVEVPAHKN
jgi:hypothetical protein